MRRIRRIAAADGQHVLAVRHVAAERGLVLPVGDHRQRVIQQRLRRPAPPRALLDRLGPAVAASLVVGALVGRGPAGDEFFERGLEIEPPRGGVKGVVDQAFRVVGKKPHREIVELGRDPAAAQNDLPRRKPGGVRHANPRRFLLAQVDLDVRPGDDEPKVVPRAGHGVEIQRHQRQDAVVPAGSVPAEIQVVAVAAAKRHRVAAVTVRRPEARPDLNLRGVLGQPGAEADLVVSPVLVSAGDEAVGDSQRAVLDADGPSAVRLPNRSIEPVERLDQRRLGGGRGQTGGQRQDRKKRQRTPRRSVHWGHLSVCGAHCRLSLRESSGFSLQRRPKTATFAERKATLASAATPSTAGRSRSCWAPT